MNFVSSITAKSAYREWTDRLLELLADAERSGQPRLKAMAAMELMHPAAATEGTDPFGWQKIIRAVADPERYRPAAKP